MQHNHRASQSASWSVAGTAVARTPGCASHSLRWGSAIAIIALLAACGSRGPSVDEANEAIKDLPQFRLLLGAAADSQKFRQLQLVSDLKCTKIGDGHYECEVLLRKNPVDGVQQTARVDFVKLGGKWRATEAN